MKLDQFANEMSEILFGYREASEEEMLSRARALKELEEGDALLKHRQKLSDALAAMQMAIDEITP